jgi:molecular chaperone GrpE
MTNEEHVPEKDVQHQENSAADASQAPEADLVQQLTAAQAEIEQLKDKYLRAVAEFSNYRKRQERDAQQQSARLKAAAFRSVLPVFDDLQLAVKNAPEDAHEYNWMEGVLLIERKFLKILGDANIKPIETVGQRFDPNLHAAMLRVPSAEQPEGYVLQEVQAGFMMDNEVLRPAAVVVSGGPAAAGEA